MTKGRGRRIIKAYRGNNPVSQETEIVYLSNARKQLDGTGKLLDKLADGTHRYSNWYSGSEGRQNLHTIRRNQRRTKRYTTIIERHSGSREIE